MNKTPNTWRLVPVDAAQHELAEVRAALGFLPQGYAAMAGLDRLADLLAASEPSTPSSAISTEHDEPITVTVDHDPRGVSVGVWQGSHCIYSGAHLLPSAPGVSKVEDKPAAYLTLDEEGSPSMLFFDVAEARTYCALGEEPEPLFRHAAPQASAEARPNNDAVDLARAGMALHAPGAPEHTVCADLVRLADVLKQPQGKPPTEDGGAHG